MSKCIICDKEADSQEYFELCQKCELEDIKSRKENPGKATKREQLEADEMYKALEKENA